MKTSLHFFLPALMLATALSLAHADEPTTAPTSGQNSSAPTAKDDKKGLHVISGPDHRVIIRHAAMETEPVTFLGVETSPVSATLTAQLGLQEGTGLVVSHIIPDSPAVGALKPHDILLKLDDQLLIEQRQLSVLIRGHKEGDEVTLTFLRAGKQTTAKVKLAKHEAPKIGFDWTQAIPGAGNAAWAFSSDGAASSSSSSSASSNSGYESGNRVDVDRLLSLIDQGPGWGTTQRMNIVRADGGPGDRTINVIVNTGNSHVALDDDKGSLELTVNDGKKSLVAKNPQGQQVFAGPIDTPEQRAALPEDVRGRLSQLEDSTQFSFKTDGDFQGAETKVLHPRGQGISAPLFQAVPRNAPLLF